MTVVEAAVEKVQDVVGAGDSKPVRTSSLVLLDPPPSPSSPALVFHAKSKQSSDGPLVL